MGESQEGRADRLYAHFHRVLGELLLELAALPATLWLTERQEHTVGGEGERNRYARAVYRVAEVGPYRERLGELGAVQQQATAALGLAQEPRELLLPTVVEDVTHVRLHEIIGYHTAPVSRQRALVKVDTALRTTRHNLAEFELYGGEGDEGVRRLVAEVRDIEAARERIAEAEGDRFRVRVKQVRYRPYVYLLGDKPVQIGSREHGLILVGPDIGVSYPNAVRRTRSDQRTVEPLFEFGKTRIYLEHEWQEAGKKASK